MYSKRHLKRLINKEKAILCEKLESVKKANEIPKTVRNVNEECSVHEEGVHENQTNNLTKKLRQWFLECSPTVKMCNRLLHILVSENIEVPKSEDNKEAMIVSLKKLIIPGGWSKNMERLIAIEVILMYNVDGKNNKKSLKIFPKFLNLLYEATLVEGKTFKDFLNDLRHGLRCVKNKHFKKVCLENKEK